jgi:hypothetical protein
MLSARERSSPLTPRYRTDMPTPPLFELQRLILWAIDLDRNAFEAGQLQGSLEYPWD